MLSIQKHLVQELVPIRVAMEQLNKLGKNLTLFVIDKDDRLVGTLTDGDIRRGLIKGLGMSDPVKSFKFEKFRYLQKNNYKIATIQELRQLGILVVPIVDDQIRIVSILNLTTSFSILPVDAVIMAGGVGERLKPLTEKIPKPMLKVGEKPIIEHNIDRLIKFGIEDITISVRYLSDQIIDFFGNGESKGISIKYVYENNPMGTIASLKEVASFNNDTILVMNSDLLTTVDFEDFYKQFEEDNSAMCIASIPYNVNIPYAVMEMQGNTVTSLQEKPTYTYYSNAGIYLIKKEMIQHIPFNKKFDATDLIEKLIELGEKVTSYPIRGYWLDIGKMDDFKKAQIDIKHLKL